MFSKEITDKIQLLKDQIVESSNKISVHVNDIHNHAKNDPSMHEDVERIQVCFASFKKELSIFEKLGLQDLEDSKVISRIQHDLLNPINCIKGFSEFILEKNNDQLIEKNLNEILAQTNNILNCIYQMNDNSTILS